MIADPDHSVNATLLLASASPRRRELVKLLGLPVEATSADIDEVPLPNEDADEMAVRLSREKAQTASSLIPHPSSFILLASDTVVSLDGEPLGKPGDAAEARSMLRRLRGRTHQVYTAITLIDRLMGSRREDVGLLDEGSVRLRMVSEHLVFHVLEADESKHEVLPKSMLLCNRAICPNR